MNRRIGLTLVGAALALVACQGPAGPEGPAGPQGPGFTAGSSISAVSPNRVFIGRSAEISISGFATEWTSSATVSFGAGATVEGITVPSSTAIIARVTIAENAQAGDRDVTVTQGGNTVTFKAGFRVSSPLEINKGAAVSVAQGELEWVDVRNLDIANPFSTSETAVVSDALFGELTGVESYSARMLLGGDVLATPGAASLTIESGPTGAATKFVHSGVTVTARTPTAVTPGTQVTGNVAAALESHLYSITTTADAIISVTASSTDTNAQPYLIAIPASGKFKDRVGTGASVGGLVARANQPVFLVYWDGSEATGYSYTLDATATPASIVAAETEPNETSMAAQIVNAAPVLVQSATISSETDVDWFRFSVGMADIGKQIRVMTKPGDTQADPKISVYAADGTTVLGGPRDSDYHEDLLVTTPVAAAGDFYVKVEFSGFFDYDPAQTKYQLLITLE